MYAYLNKIVKITESLTLAIQIGNSWHHAGSSNSCDEITTYGFNTNPRIDVMYKSWTHCYLDCKKGPLNLTDSPFIFIWVSIPLLTNWTNEHFVEITVYLFLYLTDYIR